MKSRRQPRGTPVPETVNRKERVETALVTGAVAGAAMGCVAGPLGALAGGVLGGIAGAATGSALANDAERRHAHAHDLDAQVGITSGSMGAARPDLPAARIGAYSAGSAGVGTSSPPPSEGPIQDVDE